MNRSRKSRARRIAVLALILLCLLALGIALLDDASGPQQASSSPISTPSVPQVPETRASGPKGGAAGMAPVATPAPARSGSAGSSALVVDKVPPLTPTFTQTPPDPSSNATSKFAWTSTDPAPGSGISHYLCSKENGAYVQCSSPHTYDVGTTNNGQHQFAVVAVDGAGNKSPEAKYKWKVAKGSPAEFTIAGSVSNLLIGVWKSIPVTITNPNAAPITVTSLTVTVSGIPNGCSATGNFETQAAVVPFVVPANALGHAVPAANQPRIRLRNLASDQNSCKNQTFTLSFHGSANGP